MALATLNPTQLHLIKMFSYATTESAMENIKKALLNYYASEIDREMDSLWESGDMTDERHESFRNAHFRTHQIS